MELDKDELRMRLACRDPEENVGTPGDPYNCLIAHDLEGVTGKRWVVMPRPANEGNGTYRERTTSDYIPLPEWANKLALAFDSIEGDNEPFRQVTAKEALTLFDEVLG